MIKVTNDKVTTKMKKSYTYKEEVFGKNYTKNIKNYVKNKSHTLFPRNLSKIKKHCKDKFSYSLTKGRAINFSMKFKPLPHQEPVINKVVQLFKSDVNVLLKAETRFGKTFSAIQIIHDLGVSCLIIIDKSLLVNQFIDDGRKYSSIDIVQLSKDNYKEEHDTFVTTFQFLNANPTLSNYLGDKFGLIIVDEVHCVTSLKRQQEIGKFNSRYRLGMSATPTASARSLSGMITDSFGNVKVEGKNPTGVKVAYCSVSVSHYYTYNPNRLPSEQYNEYFSREDVKSDIKEVLSELIDKNKRILLATGSQTIQNLYADVVRSMGHKVAIFNSEASNLKLKESNLSKLESAEIKFITGLGQLLKGWSGKLDVIVDLFSVGSRENTEQLIGRLRTPFDGKQTPLFIQLTPSVITNKNIKVKNYLSNLDFTYPVEFKDYLGE